MEERRDAFAAACEMSLFLENLALKCPSEYNTATIGVANLIPGGINVIPGKVVFSVDIRDCNKDTKEQLKKDMFAGFDEITARRGVTYTSQEDNNDIPLTCNERIVELLRVNCMEENLEYDELISGPYHDTLFIGRFAPAAMIFVPSRNGISHSPEEWTEYSQLKNGTEVLAKTLLDLSLIHI